MKKKVNGIVMEASSGNVFADLQLRDAEKLKIKSGLAMEISKAIDRLGLTQSDAALRMRIPQPKISALINHNFSNFSERKLMDCLNRLGYDIEINIRRGKKLEGHLRLAVDA
jgi:predicted XRE-type DNA-binding protein